MKRIAQGQSFRNIRDRGSVYIDKTREISLLISKGSRLLSQGLGASGSRSCSTPSGRSLNPERSSISGTLGFTAGGKKISTLS